MHPPSRARRILKWTGAGIALFTVIAWLSSLWYSTVVGYPNHVFGFIRAGFFSVEINEATVKGPLRWAFMHMEGVNQDQIQRMKKLNMFIGVHPREIVSGGLLHRSWGDKAFAMPPLREIQDSGIMWGLGTDAFEVNQLRPFQTLYWAVTGKMVGGTVVNTHTVSREAALIAHTRSNAYLFFRENDLGSITEGKLADLVVLDRDYFSVSDVDMRRTRPVLTVVDGEIVYDAGVI